jgi:hypothetical protein
MQINAIVRMFFKFGLTTALVLLANSQTAVAAGTGIAYVSSERDHTLTMVDMKTLEIKGVIPTCLR